MRLVITTPLAAAVQVEDVRHVRAEDGTGAFGIQPGHTDFLTALEVSVVSWRTGSGEEGHCAVRGGILRVHGGAEVSVATREAHAARTLDELSERVLAELERRQEDEAGARVEAARARLDAVRRILEHLRPGLGRPGQERPGTVPVGSGPFEWPIGGRP